MDAKACGKGQILIKGKCVPKKGIDMDWKRSDVLFRYVQLSSKADEFYSENKKEIDDALDEYENYKKTRKTKP